nr:class I SAM-dependent methyltransferase [Dactylosporangium thailandense]
MTFAPAGHAHTAAALATRLFLAGLATAELMTVYLGLRLGLYEAMADGPLTAAGLAARAGVDGRYALEWLEQQAAAGLIEVDDAGRAAAEREYTLPPGHTEALIRSGGPNSVAPMVLLPVGGVAGVLPRLLDAYRTGGGVPYAAYGDDLRGGDGGLNQAVFLRQLPGWIRRALPDVHSRLGAGAAIADVACGSGWSSIALARAYPAATVHGFDLDPASVADARANAAQAGVADRVSFAVRDAADPQLAGRYQLVCLLDALHDMARPVPVLRALRSLRAERDGCVLLMEPRAAEQPVAPADETERFLYAVSVLHCLPVGRFEQPSAATGTVLRPAAVDALAREAGFERAHPLPVEHRFHRLYRLTG